MFAGKNTKYRSQHPDFLNAERAKPHALIAFRTETLRVVLPYKASGLESWKNRVQFLVGAVAKCGNEANEPDE